jgi:hypothetical protein
MSLIQPVSELAFRSRKIDICDADLLKAEFFAPATNIVNQFCEIYFFVVGMSIQESDPCNLSV